MVAKREPAPLRLPPSFSILAGLPWRVFWCLRKVVQVRRCSRPLSGNVPIVFLSFQVFHESMEYKADGTVR